MTRESNVCFGPSAELVWLPRDVAQVLEAVILEDQLFAIHLRIWKRPLPGDTGLTLRPERDAMQDRERVRVRRTPEQLFDALREAGLPE